MAGRRLHAPGPREAVHGEFIMGGRDDDRAVCVPQARPRHRPHGLRRLSGGLTAALACPQDEHLGARCSVNQRPGGQLAG